MGTYDRAGSVTERLVEFAGTEERGNTRARKLREENNDGEESAIDFPISHEQKLDHPCQQLRW
jgi:hypothetical protein